VAHEIAGYYRLPEANAPRVELLLNVEVLAASPSPELAELVELAQQSETWLAQLLAAYAELFQPPREPRKAKVDPTQPLIQAVSLDEEEPQALGNAELEAWRKSLKEMVLRFRGALTEL
jgi:hypothetical protein